jgi:hypothetical protein
VKERKKERTNERKKERKEGRKKERERERVTIDAITHVDVHACVRKDYIHVLKIENFTD